jgi:D-3-phosphoglycerate dehydrogenase
VGQDLVKLLHPFQCTILACDIADRSAFAAAHDVQMVDQHTLFTQSQIISLHTPLTPATQHVVNADTLADMRADAFVINTARGAIVDIPALKEALQNGTIAGAALDVFDVEPPEDQSLIALPNLIATPHIGGNSNEAVLAMGRSAIGHLQQFFS